MVLGAARSGWRRGLVFFAIDLVGFVGAVLAAIRFHEIPAIGFDFMGFSERWAAFLGGLVIFVPLIVAVAMIGSRASRAMYKPGLHTLDKVLGAVIAGVLAMTIVLVALLFIRSLDFPFGLNDLIKRSAIAPAVIEAAEPAIANVDAALGLDLCGGKLRRIIPEVCRNP